jgi:hypothetical protein
MYQKHLQQVIYQRNALFDKRKIKYLSQINPSLPTLKAQLKIHKDWISICPITDSINSPAYKMTHFFRKVLDEHLTFPNEFITSYSKTSANTLTNLSMELTSNWEKVINTTKVYYYS